MTMLSELSEELVEEILSRVPLTSLSSVRSTVKQWNALSKDGIVCKADARHQFLGFMVLDSRVWSVRFDLCLNNDPSIKQIGKLDQLNKVSKVLHCNGLVLCVTSNHSRLVVWNPYLGQTKLIEPRTANFQYKYGLGFDSCGFHKVLRYWDDHRVVECEIYDLNPSSSSNNSWRVVVDVNPDWYISYGHHRCVSLKGNTYWIAIDRRRTTEEDGDEFVWDDPSIVWDDFLICFDFTTERFGPWLQLPVKGYFDATGSLSCVREEQLALMFQHSGSYMMDVWLTTKIEPQLVTWSKFFAFDMTPYGGLKSAIQHGSFFIDMEKKVTVLFDRYRDSPKRCIAYILGEDGYYMEVDLGSECKTRPIVCSYVPSLVQIE
ncbi:PREDICTED: putative F-box protein At1g32140 [Camelina sativa]|uniref:F-box protein At1g32140 n=1 Tax=Camelina sativa TaxID=90675 RepID=A0ABM0UVV7_CAMSA|nr:PREDICTED: putative F-box protein At1g32140 [Camelina sativa]